MSGGIPTLSIVHSLSLSYLKFLRSKYGFLYNISYFGAFYITIYKRIKYRKSENKFKPIFINTWKLTSTWTARWKVGGHGAL